MEGPAPLMVQGKRAGIQRGRLDLKEIGNEWTASRFRTRSSIARPMSDKSFAYKAGYQEAVFAH